MKNVRRSAWAALLLVGMLQAWTARFYATPDGISYLDLSDALRSGQFGELLNAYWSPLYPFLIGLLRLAQPAPYWEFAVVHLLNVGLFALSIVAFEYFLRALREASVRAGQTWLDRPLGLAGAYTVFGFLSLMMTPLALPTPDLLVSSAVYFAFGALLRLHADRDHPRAHLVLGAALAMGSLAKSFIIPWAGVTLLVALFATRPRFNRALIAGAIWLAAVLPWSIALSLRMGYPTFGDTGRLTYVWYVNEVESPSRKEMPHATATPVTDSVLKGIAVLPNATGTNPIWYDPSRWYQGLSPRFESGKQLKVFSYLISQYIASLGPIFLVLWFWMAVAGRDERARWWYRTWVVMIPCLAAIAAYSMVLVTTRYVAPFYVAMILVVFACARWPAELTPGNVVLGIGVPLLMMAATPQANDAVALVNAVAASALFVWLVRNRPVAVQVLVGIFGAAFIRSLQPEARLAYVVIAGVALVMAYWLTARRAIANDRSEQFSRIIRNSLVAANSALIIIVASIKIVEGMIHRPIVAAEPNNSWAGARQAALAGIQRHDRIALAGSPFEAYWMRALGARTVAVIPPPVMAGFFNLPLEKRQRLYEEFKKAGASHIVVQHNEPPDPGDKSWVAVELIGWVKSLR